MINCFFGCIYQQFVRTQTNNFVFFEASEKLLAQWLPFQKIFCRRRNNKTTVSFDVTFWSPVAFVCYNTCLLFDLKENTNFSFYHLRTKISPLPQCDPTRYNVLQRDPLRTNPFPCNFRISPTRQPFGWLPFQKNLRSNDKTKVSFDSNFWLPVTFVCYNRYLFLFCKQTLTINKH